ncbi:MAG: hypothetical protein WCQ50_21315 [Spirochaetota bacterium]
MLESVLAAPGPAHRRDPGASDRALPHFRARESILRASIDALAATLLRAMYLSVEAWIESSLHYEYFPVGFSKGEEILSLALEVERLSFGKSGGRCAALFQPLSLCGS